MSAWPCDWDAVTYCASKFFEASLIFRAQGCSVLPLLTEIVFSDVNFENCLTAAAGLRWPTILQTGSSQTHN